MRTSPRTADDIWALMGAGERTARLLAAPSGTDLPSATTHVLSAATLCSVVEGTPALGGFVTKILVKTAASGLTDAARAAVAAGGVLALCDLRGVAEPVERHRVLYHALTGEAVPAAWKPSTSVAEAEAALAMEAGVEESGGEEGDSGKSSPEAGLEARLHGLGAAGMSGLGRLKRAAVHTNRARKLKPDEDKLWHRALSYVPVVGVVGATLGAREGLELVLGRAARELRLPVPVAEPLHLLAGGAIGGSAQRAAARVREALGGDEQRRT